RDRAWMRGQAYTQFIAAGVLGAFTVFLASTTSANRTVGPGFFVLFIGLSVFLICNWLVMFIRSRQPISDDEVARRRQEERQQLFQFAQGRISWRYWLAVAIQYLLGILFLVLGAWAALSLAGDQNQLMDLVLSFALLLLAWYLLSGAIRSTRTL